MIGEDKRIIVDTNILVYANIENESFQEQARSKLLKLINSDFQLWISRQIIREFLVYATRYNFENERKPIQEFVTNIFRNFKQYNIAEDSSTTTTNLQNLLIQYNISGKKVHDANIVATMQAFKIPKILTHNTKDFERFSDIIEIVPLM